METLYSKGFSLHSLYIAQNADGLVTDHLIYCVIMPMLCYEH